MADPGRLQLCAGLVALVVISDDLGLLTMWAFGHGSAAEKQGSLYQVPGFELPIVAHELTIEVWVEEEGGDRGYSRANTKDAACCLASIPVVEIQRWCCR